MHDTVCERDEWNEKQKRKKLEKKISILRSLRSKRSPVNSVEIIWLVKIEINYFACAHTIFNFFLVEHEMCHIWSDIGTFYIYTYISMKFIHCELLLHVINEKKISTRNIAAMSHNLLACLRRIYVVDL